MENSYSAQNIELSVLMPCLNEAETIETCIRKASSFLLSNNVKGEIVIADNGSTDDSVQIARRFGARVVEVKDKGYGNALKGGINACQGKYIIMGDADNSYDFSKLLNYLDKLRLGYDLVMGNRFKGGIMKGAMPFMHKYLGNPVLSLIGKAFFNIYQINDFHCGLRGFRKTSVKRMQLKSPGMEFASEMVVKAALLKMSIVEIPIKLYPDGRYRAPHLNTWSDGCRHLRLLLNYCPRSFYYTPLVILAIVVGLFSLYLIQLTSTSI